MLVRYFTFTCSVLMGRNLLKWTTESTNVSAHVSINKRFLAKYVRLASFSNKKSPPPPSPVAAVCSKAVFCCC